jgi:branched-subunit amino acid ABC-type transport system permease component
VNSVADFAGILLGGLAAGTVLFIVSVGLSVTMGLMGFVNLAHGAFAMFGGYIIVLAMNRAQRSAWCLNGCSIGVSTARASSIRFCSRSA